MALPPKSDFISDHIANLMAQLINDFADVLVMIFLIRINMTMRESPPVDDQLSMVFVNFHGAEIVPFGFYREETIAAGFRRDVEF